MLTLLAWVIMHCLQVHLPFLHPAKAEVDWCTLFRRAGLGYIIPRHVIGADICLDLFPMGWFLFLPRNLGWHWKILSICPETLDIQSNSELAARHFHALGKWPWSICKSTSYSMCSKSHTRILYQTLRIFARHVLTYFRPRKPRER